MNIRIISVGKLKEAYLQSAIKEYAKRIGAYSKLELLEVADEPCPEGASPAVETAILAKEAAKIIPQLRERDYVIALAIQGDMLDSLQFATQIDRMATQGYHSFAFIIGGSLGLHSTVLERANFQLSFSKMTFPHQLMRIILVEQIYRAFRIQRGEPYHK